MQDDEFATERDPVTFDGRTGKPLPTPRKKHIRLQSLDDVRKEAEKVYRDARNGKVKTADASRLCYMLASIGKMIEAAEIERRLAALEKGGAPAIGEAEQLTREEFEEAARHIANSI